MIDCVKHGIRFTMPYQLRAPTERWGLMNAISHQTMRIMDKATPGTPHTKFFIQGGTIIGMARNKTHRAIQKQCLEVVLNAFSAEYDERSRVWNLKLVSFGDIPIIDSSPIKFGDIIDALEALKSPMRTHP